MQEEDKAKVVNALGGKKGIIESTIPSLVFLLTYNVTHNLRACLYVSIATAALLMIWRLIKRDTLTHSISGFVGIAFCGWFAWKTGAAKDYYAHYLIRLGVSLFEIFRNRVSRGDTHSGYLAHGINSPEIRRLLRC